MRGSGYHLQYPPPPKENNKKPKAYPVSLSSLVVGHACKAHNLSLTWEEISWDAPYRVTHRNFTRVMGSLGFLRVRLLWFSGVLVTGLKLHDASYPGSEQRDTMLASAVWTSVVWQELPRSHKLFRHIMGESRSIVLLLNDIRSCQIVASGSCKPFNFCTQRAT